MYPKATKITSIISPKSTNHLIALTVLMPAVDQGPPTSNNFSVLALTGFRSANYERSWQRNVSSPSGHSHKHKELP